MIHKFFLRCEKVLVSLLRWLSVLVELSCSALEGWLSFFMANIMNHYVVLWKVGCFFMANVMNHYVVF